MRQGIINRCSSQPPIHAPTLRESLGHNHIHVNAAANHHFRNTIDEAEHVKRGVLPPSPKEILGKYLDIFATETREDIKRLEPYWDEHGCSLLCDGWTQRCPPSILWFIAIERLCC